MNIKNILGTLMILIPIIAAIAALGINMLIPIAIGIAVGIWMLIAILLIES